MAVARSCEAVGLSRTAWYRERSDSLERDREVIEALQAIVEEHNRWGFWKCYRRMRLDGHVWNHKRVHRVYRDLGLNLRRKTKKRVPTRDPQPMEAPGLPNEIWSVDFMHDALNIGRRFRTLNMLDEGVREVLDIEIDTSLPGERVVQVLERLRSWRGLPKAIRCDNGPELLSEVFVSWCEVNGIEIRYIQRGSPIRMPSSSASTGPIGRRSWTPICSRAWTRCGRSRTSGWRATTSGVLMTHRAGCRRLRIEN